MRTLEASRSRWNVLYSDEKIGLDLRQAVRDLKKEPNDCEDGLRSVCWKVRREYQYLIYCLDKYPGFPPLWAPQSSFMAKEGLGFKKRLLLPPRAFPEVH